MKAKMLFGPPGCGKTHAAKMRAKELQANYLEHMFHSWSSDEELFTGVNITAAIAGDAENVRQDGILTKAARLSHEGLVVLLLDELDKAPERVEFLLLQFLQDGIAPVKPGEYVQANLTNLEVFITSNEVREHSDALLRRVKRVFMNPLPDEVTIDAMHSASKFNLQECTLIWRVAKAIAKEEGNEALSLQEGTCLVEDLTKAASHSDVVEAFQGWAARTREGARFASAIPQTDTVWGIVKKANSL
jgi:MoxR-like ATPase